jgi:hypothetical protein
MILPPSRWQRVALAALLVLALVLIVVLSAPAWIALPFLSKPRRDGVIQFLGCLIDWIKADRLAEIGARQALLALIVSLALPREQERKHTCARAATSPVTAALVEVQAI